jgi:hypothetical protein
VDAFSVQIILPTSQFVLRARPLRLPFLH